MTIKTRKEWIIGETTVGGAFITLANPGFVSWARINADNTITARTATETRADLAVPGYVTAPTTLTDFTMFPSATPPTTGFYMAGDDNFIYTFVTGVDTTSWQQTPRSS